MATIRDIAKAAGVSVATVSHVVNNTRYVSPKLRAQVEMAIDQADSVPNFVIRKRSGSSGEGRGTGTEYIIILMTEADSPYSVSLKKKMTEKLEEKGYCVLCFNLNGRDKIKLLRSGHLSDGNLKGLLVSVSNPTEEMTEYIRSFRVPRVMIGNQIPGDTCDRVLSSNFEGAFNAASHLIRSGHERIAILCGTDEVESNHERIEGYKRALKAHNIEYLDSLVVDNLTGKQQINDILSRMLMSANPPTAVFAANYEIVLNTYRFLSENSIQCPKDVSVVGFNDFQWAPFVEPALTTIRQDVDSISENAVRILLSRIQDNTDNPAERVEIPTELCIRASTRSIGRGPFGEAAGDLSDVSISEEEKQYSQKGKYTAAISFHYSGKSWMRLQEMGIREVFDKLNISIISVTDAHFDPDLQVKQLKSIQMLEPDILISIPTDNKLTSEAYRSFVGTRTKMIFISNVPEGIRPQDYITCVSVNELSHGRNIGRGIGEYMRKHHLTNVAVIKHDSGNFYTTMQRDKAGIQILTEEYPELNICAVEEFEREEDAYAITCRLIKEHPEIEGMYVSWEGPTEYVQNALMDVGRPDVAIATGDLEYNMAMSIATDGSVKAVSAQCPYEQGQAIALSAAKALLGQSIPSYISVEPVFTDKYNLAKSWRKVHKEELPSDIREALSQSFSDNR